MTIYEDTRQQHGKHDNIRKYCEENGIQIRRTKLDTGDYISPPAISIDTKKGMAEIYSDIVSDHARFRAECVRAMEDGIKLIILIEEDTIRSLEDAEKWVNPFATQKTKDSKRLVTSMRTMSMRYGVEWRFCHPDDTGRTVVEILASCR